MRLLTIIPLAMLLASCANTPTVIIKPDGTVVANLGQSVFEDADAESASITLRDGTNLTYTKVGKSQTKVPNNYIGYKTLTGLADIANGGEAIREKGQTMRSGQAAGVEKARIQADVTKATFVPPEP